MISSSPEHYMYSKLTTHCAPVIILVVLLPVRLPAHTVDLSWRVATPVISFTDHVHSRYVQAAIHR